MAAAQRRRNVSISLPAELADQLDAWAAADGRNRSAVIVDLLKAERRRRFEVDLEQAYREMTEDGFYDDIELYFPAQAEVVLARPDDPQAG